MEARKDGRRVQRTQQLLRASLVSLIEEKGFEALTVQDIIDRANVGRATFYAHFDNKEDLLVSLFDEVMSEHLEGKRRDTLCLTWEERRWTRKRVTTAAGREVALALPTGSVLRPGDVVAVESEWYLAVEASPEPVLAIRPRSPAEAIRIAFEVGNRHFPLALDGELLLVPDDSAMEQLLRRLDASWQRRQAVFDPLGGPLHQHAASPLDGHTHG